ncbi:SDR family NAD(P)-dependent oxidoreductase [Actinomycetospora sp.]|uniref:SDR family NAD(P)-dependent oxidoreductase n=1 Tax=Actinomycetospora sp. TaxID=1872135 RepID=UPI002F3FC745
MRTPESLTALVTGATDGVGREVATRLAQLGATVLVHGRDDARIEATIAAIRERTGACDLRPLRADLSRLAEVDGLADEVLASVDELNLVVSNAGVGFGPPTGHREVSPDGHELRWAVNHLAPHHLLRRLAPLLCRSAPARVVAVTSIGQAALDLDDLQTEHDWDGTLAYRRSKLAATMSAFDLAEGLRGTGVAVHVLHPATLMDTAMIREAEVPPESTVEQGVTALVRLTLDPELDHRTAGFFSGSYPDDAALHAQVSDEHVRAELRRRTEETVAATLGGPDVPAQAGTPDAQPDSMTFV